MKKILISLLCVGSLGLPAMALAQRGPKHPPRRPPPEAIEACKDRASGDRCSFTSPHGTLSGTCWAPSEDLPLACRPDQHPRGR